LKNLSIGTQEVCFVVKNSHNWVVPFDNDVQKHRGAQAYSNFMEKYAASMSSDTKSFEEFSQDLFTSVTAWKGILCVD
jgi:hypothetical protein